MLYNPAESKIGMAVLIYLQGEGAIPYYGVVKRRNINLSMFPL